MWTQGNFHNKFLHYAEFSNNNVEDYSLISDLSVLSVFNFILVILWDTLMLSLW